jgi:hypothetical protein
MSEQWSASQYRSQIRTEMLRVWNALISLTERDKVWITKTVQKEDA